MSGALASFVEKRVTVVTYDGRTIAGAVKGYDQTSNLILADAVERIYSLDEPVEEAPLGLYIIRGDNIVLVGEMDAQAESKLDFNSIRADPLDEIHF